MGMIDAQLEMCTASGQAVTASAASTDLIDLQTAVRNLGKGQPLYWNIALTAAMTDSSSNSTVVPTLETDTTAAFSTPTLAAQTAPTFSAVSAAGTGYSVRLQQFTTAERYLRTYFTVANGNLDTGTFRSWISTVPHYSAWVAKPNGYDV